MLQQIVPVRLIRPIVLLMAALLLCCCGPSIAAPPTAEPTAVPTVTPIPPSPTPTPIPLVETIPIDLAQRQMLATFQRWTTGEEIGIDCVLNAACNQYMKVQATFMTPELIEDLARLKIAELQLNGQHPTVPDLQGLISEMSQKLKLDEHLTFMLVAKPGTRTLPLNAAQTIPLQGQVSLHNQRGQSFQAVELDLSLNHIAEEEGTESRGYILFKRKGEDGAEIIDMKNDRQVSIVLQLPPDTKINRQELAWTFDLLDASRPSPLAPTPTPVPSISPQEWFDIAKDTIALLREGVLKIPSLP